MINEDLPSKSDLEDMKVRLEQKVNSHGESEAVLKGWPDIYAGEFTTTRNFTYQIVKWFIGTPRRARRKVKGYGWMVVMTLLIGIGIIGLSMRSPYGVYILMDFLVFFLLTYAVWHYIVKKNNYFGAYRLLQKGERYPVAYQKDETGKIIFSWETAKETMNDVLRIPYEVLDSVLAYGIIEERSINNGVTWYVKGWYHNMVWGPLLYANLDTTQFNILSEQVTIYPENVERAMDKLRRYGSKHDIPEEDLRYLMMKTKEMYALTDMLHENEKELLDMYGKRLVKVKFTKKTFAFFKAWQPLVQEIEAEKLKWKEASKMKKSEWMSEINTAREVSMEAKMIDTIRKEAYERGRKYGATETENMYMSAFGKPSEVIQSEKAKQAHDLTEYHEELLRKTYAKEILGSDEDGNTENNTPQ